MNEKWVFLLVLKTLGYWAAIGLFFSCNQPKRSVPTSSLPIPIVVEARGHVIPEDSIQLPIQIPLRSPRVVQAGKPSNVSITTGQRFFAAPPHLKAGTPIVHIAGQNGFALPQRVAAIHKPIVAGRPEPILAKAPLTKDHNPKNINTFGLVHGLKNLNISEIVQDRFGNLWIATGYGGVAKYDGKSFMNYTEEEGLANNTVLGILKDRRGNLWFATFMGASKFDGMTFTNYGRKEGLVHDLVFDIIEDKDGTIWFATYGGLSRLDPSQQTFTNFTQKQGLPFNLVHRIQQDRAGNIWLGMYQHGVSRLQVNREKNREIVSFVSYTEKEGLTANNVVSILGDKQGNVWFGTAAGVTKFRPEKNGQGGYFQHFTDKNGLSGNATEAIIEDRKGRIIFGTINGVTIYDPVQRLFSYLTTEDGLPKNSILSVFDDGRGTLWIGTEDGGFCKYNPSAFTFLTKADGLASQVILAIQEDRRGNLWFGTQGQGVIKYRPAQGHQPGTFTQYTDREGLSDNDIQAICEDRRGNLWFGTRNGGATKYTPASRGDGGTFTHYTTQQGLPANFVMSLFADQAGSMWFGIYDLTNGGVTKFDGETFTHFSIEQGLRKREIITIAQDKRGSFWFGTWGDGITKYKPAPDGQKGTFIHFNTNNGLVSNKIRPITIDSRGAVWLGTIGGGVSKYQEGANGKTGTFTQYTEREGLSDNDVRSILEDRRGNIWFGNYYGMSKLSANQNGGNRYFINFTPEDGFQGTRCLANSICEDRTGKIWIGTYNELTVFDPAMVQADTTLPNVQLTAVKPFDERVAWEADTSFVLRNGIRVADFYFDRLSSWFYIPGQLSLTYNNNFITFEFVGINVNTPQTVRYQYQLAGLDKTWSSSTNRSEATYGNLAPGDYTFRVRARNGEGRWSRECQYTFRIRPPWWETWWAYLTYCLLTAGITYAFIQYRVAQGLERIKALEAIRTKISSDLHDDVGSILSGLAMQSQMIALTAHEEQKQPLNEISAMSHEAMEHMRDTVWAIDSRKDKYENLIDRMRAFAERTFNRGDTTYDFDITIDDARKFIDPQRRQNIYLIFKEAICNIDKHSDASHVVINLAQSKSQLYLLIHDNGSPKKTVNSDGLGLANMKMRATQLGGQLTARYENGFKVELVLT